jgi:hypothetical protein
MADKPKIEPKKIRIESTRPAFFKLHVAEWRTDKQGQLDKGTAAKPKKPKYQVTLLLDPSNVQAQNTIKEIKEEAARLLDHRYTSRENWPKDNEITGRKGILNCFGLGNKLPKVYDGFKDMFYVRCATSSSILTPGYGFDGDRPLLGARDGRGVQLLQDGQWHYLDKNRNPTDEIADQSICPYAGANCRARISLFTWDYEGGGVNANILSLQFVSPNTAFGGGAANRSADEEFEAYGEYAKQNAAAPDPFDS